MMHGDNSLKEARSTINQAREVWSVLARKQRLTLTAALLLMAVAAALISAIPVVLGLLVDAMLDKQVRSMGEALPYLCILAVAYLGREAIHVGRKIIVESTCTQVEQTMIVRLISQLFRANLEAVSSERVGALNGRIHRSVGGMVQLLKLSFLDFFPAALSALFSITVAIARYPLLGIVMAMVIPIGGYVVLRQLVSQRGVRIDLLRSKEEMDGTIVEQIVGLEYVRAANTYKGELAKIARISERLRSMEMRHHIAMALYDCAKSLNEGAFHIIVITFAMSLALSKAISIGDVLVFSALFVSVVNPLREVHRIFDEAHESSIRAADLFVLLAEPVDCSFEPAECCVPKLADDIPLIVAEHLKVEYGRHGGASPREGLTDCSFSIRRGEVIGLAGPSGAGKSTIVRALLRLAHPSVGTLYLGGAPIQSISREEVGNLFGYVSQNPFLFSGTIEENIKYGYPGATDDNVRRAAALAQIDHEIIAMPGGFKAHVSERGQNLSGGQRQRIALARIFLKDPPILVLDEATAALDCENERAVMAALSAAMKGRTVLMVAHRLSSLRQADRIFVFDKGRIVESDNFENLARIEGGVFSTLLNGVKGQSSATASCQDKTHPE